jgi:hypothetical protein
MKISHEEVKRVLKTGFKLILDRVYTAPSNEEMYATVNRFIRHRNLLTELKEALDKENVTRDDLKEIIDKKFGIVEPFKYMRESHDCDNASFELTAWLSGKNYPAGPVIIEGHSLIVFINEDFERVFLDQYTGRVVETNERLKVTVIP